LSYAFAELINFKQAWFRRVKLDEVYLLPSRKLFILYYILNRNTDKVSFDFFLPYYPTNLPNEPDSATIFISFSFAILGEF
jgi:hypothetical protein